MAFLDDEITSDGSPTIAGVLQDFGNKLQKDLIQSLRNKTSSNTSLKLQQSIRFDVFFEQGWHFQLFMEDYGDFIDEGVKGRGGARKTTSKFSGANKGRVFRQKAPNSQFKFTTKRPPINRELETWANVKGINKYALQESIFRQGIKPTHFYTDVVNETLVDGLIKQLEVAGAKGIEIELADIFKGHGNNN